MENLNYATELTNGILNMYKIATDKSTTFEKKITIRQDLRGLLLSCVDYGIESPISINRVNRIGMAEQCETVSMKIDMLIENLKFLSYKHGANSKNLAHEFIITLLELAIETTVENTLNLPKSLSIIETVNILDTIPINRHQEDTTNFEGLDTLLDLMSAARHLIMEARKWNITKETQYLTLEETYNIHEAFEYMLNNQEDKVIIKLT